MSISALSGPEIVFGQAPGSQDYNPDRGTSLYDQSAGIMDPRSAYAYSPGGNGLIYGWAGFTRICVLDTAPAALGVGAIAAAANVTSGTAMTLVSTNGAGIVVGQSIVNAATGATVTGLLAIGQKGGAVALGQTGLINLWDPTKMLARAVSVTGASGGAGGIFIVKGYDAYNFPMSESITATAGATSVNGKKAFKYIASVTPQFTDAHNYSIDTTDIIGFGLRVDKFPFVEIYDGAAATTGTLITATTGFVAAVTTDPATTTTGDVRGTYALQTASDGTRSTQIFVTIPVANLSTAKGLVGVTQV